MKTGSRPIDMSRILFFAPSPRNRRSRTGLFFGLAATLLLGAATAHAQYDAPQTTPVHDPSALHPPAGAKVAIVEFADMECPACGQANPVVKAAVEKYHIPWIRHDFPLPMHNWSFNAAVYARWFDTKSKKIGDDYRDYIFANQMMINNPGDLTQYTETFAKSRGLALPFSVDPQGKLAAEVKADYAIGQRIGIDHTPTIWVVTSGSRGAPYIEVTNTSKLYQIIDQAIDDTRGR